MLEAIREGKQGVANPRVDNETVETLGTPIDEVRQVESSLLRKMGTMAARARDQWS